MSMMLNKARFAIGAAAVAAAVVAGVALRSAKLGGPAARDRGAASPAGAKPSRPKVVLTALKARDITVTLRYICQLRSQRHLVIRAPGAGLLDEIQVKEGQAMKQGDPMFKITPALARSKLDARMAEVELARLEYENVKKSSEARKPDHPQNELALARARLAKANAGLQLAKAEMDFGNLRAPFDGIVDRLDDSSAAHVSEGDILCNLSDNSAMRAYYHVSEQGYLDYMAGREQFEADKLELLLANGARYPQPGKIAAIENQISNETGNITFRADFPNPDRLLRHGQAGTLLIRRKLHDALVVPVRATFEVLDKKYVYVVDKEDLAHRREIVVQNEVDDLFVVKKGIDGGDRIIVQNAEDGHFVIKKGVEVGDRIILDAIDEARDGEKVEFELRPQEPAGSAPSTIPEVAITPKLR